MGVAWRGIYICVRLCDADSRRIACEAVVCHSPVAALRVRASPFFCVCAKWQVVCAAGREVGLRRPCVGRWRAVRAAWVLGLVCFLKS
jgi:hypothetical protein